MKNTSLRPGPVTLYAQLANILRDRIVSGVWKSGGEVPTLEQLVQEFSVARVTVRQAVQLLVDEKLLSSQRGRRTYVTFESRGLETNPLYSSTGSIDTDGGNFTINVLSKQELDSLPAYLAGPGSPAGKYMRIRKIDSQNGVPYAVSDNFVLLSLYKRFPANIETRAKLSRLVRDHARPKLTSGFERISVSELNYEEASQLQVPIGSPAARVTRIFLEPGDKIAYVGQFVYRADRFAIERDISHLITGDAPAGDKPARRTAAGKASLASGAARP
ncbi:MAG: GntR family transcriptional regulator [Burkholderiales bacterium]